MEDLDLFGDQPCRMPRNPEPRNPIVLPKTPPELKAARALSAQMRGRLSRREKQKVAHLICLNLISLLRQGARRESLPFTVKRYIVNR